jgi:hypothetical protein
MRCLVKRPIRKAVPSGEAEIHLISLFPVGGLVACGKSVRPSDLKQESQVTDSESSSPVYECIYVSVMHSSQKPEERRWTKEAIIIIIITERLLIIQQGKNRNRQKHATPRTSRSRSPGPYT